MNNLSSPQGVEAKHSLAWAVPAQPTGQDPPCRLPLVSSAFIPALVGLLDPWHPAGAAGTCGHSQTSVPRALSFSSCFAG